MKMLGTKRNGPREVEERYSRRLENGVEIVERETLHIIRINGDRYDTIRAGSAPRLVVSDAPATAKLLIAKTRSEIAGLDALLRSLARRPVEAE